MALRNLGIKLTPKLEHLHNHNSRPLKKTTKIGIPNSYHGLVEPPFLKWRLYHDYSTNFMPYL